MAGKDQQKYKNCDRKGVVVGILGKDTHGTRRGVERGMRGGRGRGHEKANEMPLWLGGSNPEIISQMVAFLNINKGDKFGCISLHNIYCVMLLKLEPFFNTK